LGTGLSGGAVPIFGGIVLSSERMNRIVEIDRENPMVTTEPGIITGSFRKRWNLRGFFIRFAQTSEDRLRSELYSQSGEDLRSLKGYLQYKFFLYRKSKD
jgi:hypothetical protein